MAGWIEGEGMKRSKFQGDDKILAQNLARKIEKGNPRRSIGVQDTITTEQQMGAGYPKINRITQEGTQTNVAGGDVRYRKQMGGGRSGKESSYVSLQRQAGGGDVGRVGVSTFGGQMKFKGAEVSPEGEITTRFRNPFRAKRAKKAIAATPAFKKN
tara:strand:- start:677 stop:1144 length:468 start_codon:yes stop_codon:yes gene_type:complete